MYVYINMGHATLKYLWKRVFLPNNFWLKLSFMGPRVKLSLPRLSKTEGRGNPHLSFCMGDGRTGRTSWGRVEREESCGTFSKLPGWWEGKVGRGGGVCVAMHLCARRSQLARQTCCSYNFPATREKEREYLVWHAHRIWFQAQVTFMFACSLSLSLSLFICPLILLTLLLSVSSC